MRILDFAPTPLFPRAPGPGLQIARLTLAADRPQEVTAEVNLPGDRWTSANLRVSQGGHTYQVVIPEAPAGGRVRVQLVSATGETVAAYEACWRPSRKWTLFVMPTGHIDLYSTGLAHETPGEHAVMLDRAVELAEESPDYRYQIENMLPVFEYRQLRDHKTFARLIRRMRSGQIAFGAQYTGIHLEEASGEELVQGQLLMARELEAEYGIRPNCGYTVDVPSTTIQYAQLLSRCGISGWIFSPNRFPPPNGWYGLGQSIRRLPHLVRAEGLDGSGVFLWLTHEHYGEDQKLFGLDGEDVSLAAPRVAERLVHLEEQSYAWDAYLLEFSYGDNLPPTRSLPLLVSAWRERYEFPRLLLATAGDFFHHVRSELPAAPAMRLEVLDVWAYVVANQGVLNPMARRAAANLVSAQALLSTRNARYPKATFRDAFSDLAKFAAHDWWYGGGQVAGVPDLAKATWARGASEKALDALARAAKSQGEARGRALVGANPCAFPRHDVVVAPPVVAGAAAPAGVPAQTVDAATLTGYFATQPPAIAHPPREAEPREGVVLAVDVPPLGAAPLRPRRPEPGKRHAEAFIENRYFAVRFDPELGAIGGIVDKADRVELLDTSREGFGQLLLGRPQWEGFGIGFGGSYEEAVERMRHSLKAWDACHLQLDHGLRGPVFSSLVLRGRLHQSPVTQVVILYEDIRRIDVVTTVEWDNEPSACRLVAAFPFSLAPFACRYEVPFGVLEAGRDEAPTFPRHLRQLESWLAFHGGERSVVLASPDVGVFSLGRCDLNPVDDGAYTEPERPAAYFILADNGAPSPLVQPGRLAVRFSLTTGTRLRPSDCARFAWGVRRPLLVSSGSPRTDDALEISPDSLLVTTVKRAWGGRGLVVRAVEYDGRSGEGTLRLPFVAKQVRLADPVERPLTALNTDGRTIRFPFSQHEILTFLVQP